MNLSTIASRLQPKHWRNLARLFRNHQWEANDDGEILIGHARISGAYETLAPDGLGSIVTKNLWTIEGMNYLLSAGMGNGVQVGTWYVAPFSGNVTITDTLTAATFASATTELTTQYSEASRVTYTESVPANRSTNNTANPAVFTSASDNVNIWGIGLLSISTKGSTSGILLSAAKYSTVRNLPVTGDQISVKYTVTLSNS